MDDAERRKLATQLCIRFVPEEYAVPLAEELVAMGLGERGMLARIAEFRAELDESVDRVRYVVRDGKLVRLPVEPKKGGN